MISDNLFPIAMFVFFIMAIGLGLTLLEFRYGKAKRELDDADRKVGSAGKDEPAG
tara:strand:- start:1639 stop:1803 length:165 start_codon:yes stop_codon:yes gene_type:complete